MFGKGKGQQTYDQSNTDIGRNPNQHFTLTKFFNRFSNRFVVPVDEKLPAVPILGAGNHYTRQLNPYAPQIVAPQLVTNIAITGDGSNLFGQLASIPLVDLNNAAPGN